MNPKGVEIFLTCYEKDSYIFINNYSIFVNYLLIVICSSPFIKNMNSSTHAQMLQIFITNIPLFFINDDKVYDG